MASLTVIAMLAFAANSVLARLGLRRGEIDALGYTGIRLIAGACMLAVLVYLRQRRAGSGKLELGGSWAAALALFGYALAFSIAYLMIGAGTGALILFATVQMSMLSWAIFKGDRPGGIEVLGIVLAFGGLIYLVLPGVVAPSLAGAALMVGAGVCWAAYTLIGRGSRSPLLDTDGNFVRCLPLALVVAVAGTMVHPPSLAGLVYAAASGAIASGLGYAIWYAVLPSLTRIRAAFVQLTVPAIAAAGGVLFISEPLTLRLVVASLGILGGVALAIGAAELRKARRAAAG